MTPTVVFVPGHLCGPWLYEAQIAAVAPRAPVAVADVTRDESIAGMAERLLAGHAGPLVLVGLSMGGMVAMEAMAAEPERIAGAMLLSTDPHPARPREIAWRVGEATDVQERGTAGYAARFAARFFAHDEAVAARLGPEAEARMAAMPAALFHAQAKALDTRRDMPPLIRGFAAPVEVMVGSEDRVCPPKLHPPIAEACADARLTEIPGVGHLSCLEVPETVTARLLALLDRVGDGPA